MDLSFRKLPCVSRRGRFILFLMLAAAPAMAVSIDFGVAAEGRLVPGEGLLKLAAPAGGTVASLSVQAGDRVDKGALVATLAGIAGARAELAAAEAEAAAAEAAIPVAAAGLSAAEVAAAVAADAIVVAQAQLREATAGVVSAEKERTHALAQEAAAVAHLEGQIAEYQRVIDELDPPRKDREELLIKQNMLQLQINQLNEQQATLEAALEATVAGAQAAQEVAQAHLEAARRQVQGASADQQRAQMVLAEAEARAEVARSDVATAAAGIAAYEIKAPIAGQVISVLARPGESAAGGVIYMGDTTKMYVEAEVYIDDVRRVRPGQSVRIESSAFEGELGGHVSDVGRMVSPANVYSPDPSVFTDRRVVKVRIALDDSTRVANLTYAQVTVRIDTSGPSEKKPSAP